MLHGLNSPPLKNPPSINSLSPVSSGPIPMRATVLSLRSFSSLLISTAVQRQIWHPKRRRKNITTAWCLHREPSSTCWEKNTTIKENIYFSVGQMASVASAVEQCSDAVTMFGQALNISGLFFSSIKRALKAWLGLLQKHSVN